MPEIYGKDRHQITFSSLEDRIPPDNIVRFIDALKRLYRDSFLSKKFWLRFFWGCSRINGTSCATATRVSSSFIVSFSKQLL
jgi:hypothetical protein